MRIRDQIAQKYRLLAAREEVATRYIADGFAVEIEAMLGDFRADLVARRGDELVVVEFKSVAWDKSRTDQAIQLRR